MPYITQDARDRIHDKVGASFDSAVQAMECSQDLSYIVAHLVWMFLRKRSDEINVHPVLEKVIQRLKNRLNHRIRSSKIQECANEIGTVLNPVAGEFNYAISLLIHRYFMQHKLCYSNINQLVGVLERIKIDCMLQFSSLQGNHYQMEVIDDVYGLLVCVQLELYRVLAGPYEDGKMVENGSVSPLDRPYYNKILLKRYGAVDVG